MKRLLVEQVGATLLVCLASTSAFAQSTQSANTTQAFMPTSDVNVGYHALPTRAPQNAETGYRLSDSAIMHYGVGAEAGYDSNVFYRDKGGAYPVVGSGLLRITPFLEFTNAGRGGVQPSGAFWDLTAALQYREYFASEAKGLRAFNPLVSGMVDLHSSQQLSLAFGETFVRTEEPPFTGGDPLKRDSNNAYAQLKWAPGGGRLQSTLRYTNAIDYWENTGPLHDASAMYHQMMLDVAWSWLPKTAVFVRVDQGYVSYFSGPRQSSYPLHAMLGLRGLITPKISVYLATGYMNGFFSGASTGGLRGSLAGVAEVTYRPTLTSQIILGYRHDFVNSPLGQFMYNDAAYAVFRQQMAGVFSASLSGRYEYRTYVGIDAAASPNSTRNDNLFTGGAALDYMFRPWIFAGIGYTLLTDSTDYVSTVYGALGSYVKHQVFARLSLTY